jgi:hypothetical protein
MADVWIQCPACRVLHQLRDEDARADPRCIHCRSGGPQPASGEPVGWHYAVGKQKLGPFTLAELLVMRRDGRLQPDDMVLPSGAVKWVRADSLAELQAS